jgi:HEAT repeat protein
MLRLFSSAADKREEGFRKEWEPRLFEFLLSDESPDAFVSSLDRKDYGRFLSMLRDFLVVTKGEDFERAASLIVGTKIYDHLMDALKSRRSSKKIEAAYYLGLTRAERAKARLVEGLTNAGGGEYRYYAVALARMNALETAPLILDRMRKKPPSSKEETISVFQEFQREICYHLLDIMESERDEFFKVVFVAVFSRFKFFEAEEEILRFLEQAETKEGKIVAIRALGEIEFVETGAPLRQYLHDSDPDVVCETIVAVAKIRDITFEKELLYKMNSDNGRVRYLAAKALLSLSATGRRWVERLAQRNLNDRASLVARTVVDERRLGV